MVATPEATGERTGEGAGLLKAARGEAVGGLAELLFVESEKQRRMCIARKGAREARLAIRDRSLGRQGVVGVGIEPEGRRILSLCDSQGGEILEPSGDEKSGRQGVSSADPVIDIECEHLAQLG